MNIYSYYTEVPGISGYDSLKLIAGWRERWKAIGFEPVVLGEWQARQHPYFDELHAAVSKLPTQNSAKYEEACFHRWLALVQAGGGFMCDYDVFPMSKESVLPSFTGVELGKLQLLQSNCVCPCLVHASRTVAERVCREFVTGKITMHEINGKPHTSDQYVIEGWVKDGADWIEQKDCVLLWTEPGWETRPFVHFANRVALQHGKYPRWQHLHEVLK